MKYAVIVAVLGILVAGMLAWFYFDFHGTKVPQVVTTTAAVSAAPKNIPFKIIDSGLTASGEPTRKNYAINDVAAFTIFWKETHGGETKGMPVIDFSKNYVIGVFAGNVPTHGYSIKVAKVTDADVTRSVDVEIDQPGETCTVIEETTSPYQFVSVPISDTEAFAHTDTTQKKDCK